MASALFVTLASASAQAQGAADPYAPYERLLRAAVRPSGVDYGALRARLPELRAVAQWFATHGPTSTPAEFATDDARLAYWLNAYNVTVLRAIAESPASLRSVMDAMPNSGFFRARTHSVDGRSLTLDVIENREVRERFRDARVHAALNCGARSCPPLSAQAFRLRTVRAQLDQLARAWVARGAYTLDASARTVRASMLFQWFASDFSAPIAGRSAPEINGPLRFVYAFASAAQQRALVSACGPTLAGCAVQHGTYDWSLNASR